MINVSSYPDSHYFREHAVSLNKCTINPFGVSLKSHPTQDATSHSTESSRGRAQKARSSPHDISSRGRAQKARSSPHDISSRGVLGAPKGSPCGRVAVSDAVCLAHDAAKAATVRCRAQKARSSPMRLRSLCHHLGCRCVLLVPVLDIST